MRGGGLSLERIKALNSIHSFLLILLLSVLPLLVLPILVLSTSSSSLVVTLVASSSCYLVHAALLLVPLKLLLPLMILILRRLASLSSWPFSFFSSLLITSLVLCPIGILCTLGLCLSGCIRMELLIVHLDILRQVEKSD